MLAEPHGVENLTVKLPRVSSSEVIVNVAEPFALIVLDDGVTLRLPGTDDGETVPLAPALNVILTVPFPPCFEIESEEGLIVGTQGTGVGVGVGVGKGLGVGVGVGNGLGVGVGVGLQFAPLFPQGVGEGVGVG